MDNIQKVMQRITAIEQRFGGVSCAPDTQFSAVLASEQSKQPATTISADSSNWNIESIIQAAARKYNVDSKLAMAVAVAESNLEPQAVSSQGAAGVMQLMPETAKGLGVKNIWDPRENIDGGVRYLKQLLSTFNGNVEQAVAAYNAGPEAVRRYGGVPPYSETRAYVNKVLTLSS